MGDPKFARAGLPRTRAPLAASDYPTHDPIAAIPQQKMPSRLIDVWMHAAMRQTDDSRSKRWRPREARPPDLSSGDSKALRGQTAVSRKRGSIRGATGASADRLGTSEYRAAA